MWYLLVQAYIRIGFGTDSVICSILHAYKKSPWLTALEMTILVLDTNKIKTVRQ